MSTTGHTRPGREAGFTIVEVMMAMVVLVVGMLGVSLMLSQASQTTADNKARGQALSLARELTEGARSQAYTNLEPTTVVGLEQANSALADSDPDTAGWQVERRGKTFNVAVGVCSVDDINDGSGTRDTATFCASGGGSTSSATCQEGYGSGDSIAGNGTLAGVAVGDCGLDTDRDGRVDGLTGACAASACPVSAKVDKNPDDFKRLVILVRWRSGPGRTYVLQNTTIDYPGVTAAPAVTGIVPNPDIRPSNELTTGTTLNFTATTNKAAQTVAWYVNGQPQDAAATGGSGTTWTFGWNLGAVGATSPGANQVLDGDYLVEAKGFDKFGQYGARFPYSVKLNRRQPYPVPAFQSIRVGPAVEMDWSKSAEGDVVGYQVQRVTGSTTTVCSPSTATSCRDDAPPASGTVTYRIWAQDKVPGGASTRDGDVFTAAAIDMANGVPAAPASLTATKAGSGTAVTLTWPSAADPEDGTVQKYAIFRDGTALSDLYGYVTVSGTAVPPYSWSDPNGLGHSYWIAAVDSKDAQSLKSSGTGVVQ